jgi:ketosteroid isomerase-like protein
MLSIYKSLSGNISDATVHITGNTAWATALYHGVGKKKDGSKDDVMHIRVTNIWEKRAGQWVIVHEHASVPMG